MSKKQASLKDYLSDLDDLYQRALGKENIGIAFKIKETQMKACKQGLGNLQDFDPDDVSDEKLDHLICILEEKNKNYFEKEI